MKFINTIMLFVSEEIIMNDFINFLKDVFMLKKEDNIKVGLTQFKREPVKNAPKEVSIKTKDVKLSDLMRRAS